MLLLLSYSESLISVYGLLIIRYPFVIYAIICQFGKRLEGRGNLWFTVNGYRLKS